MEKGTDVVFVSDNVIEGYVTDKEMLSLLKEFSDDGNEEYSILNMRIVFAGGKRYRQYDVGLCTLHHDLDDKCIEEVLWVDEDLLKEVENDKTTN